MDNFILSVLWVVAVAISAFNVGRYYPTENRKMINKIDKDLICIEAQMSVINFYMEKETSISSCETIVKKYER